jgi:hypothetical protein
MKPDVDWLMEPSDPAALNLARGLNEDGSFPYYPKISAHVVLAIVAADALHALPLVLATHRRMHMRQRDAIPLTKSIWRAAGYPDPDDWRRRTALAQLRRVPQVLGLEEKRSRYARYRLKRGPLWKRKPRLDDLDREDGEE